MNKKLKTYIKKLTLDIDKIPKKRKKLLLDIAGYLKQDCFNENRANIIFICTHNSRRSQLAQCWSIASSQYYNLKNINFFSGGMETTSFNRKALNALKRSGFIIDQKNQEAQVYLLKTSKTSDGQKFFSKRYDYKRNPQKKFLAIMTCSDADKKCPFVKGADKKIFLPYHDPRRSDGSDLEESIYDQSCYIIAQEMFYIMKKARGVI
jgi:arsenate reductase (thioredoxin)